MRSRLVSLFILFGVVNAFGSFSFTQPLTRQIFQRNPFNKGKVFVFGPTNGATAKVRLTPRGGYAGTDTGLLAIPVVSGNVEGTVLVDAGWYDLEVQIFDGGGGMTDDVTLPRIGVGDVFITSGQSNAANYYSPFTAGTPNDAVNARGLTSILPWQNATDPQPSVDNTLSSVWPNLGNLIFASTGFPVGFVGTAQGNTTVAQWLPGTSNYALLKSAIALFPKQGFRMVLWHQGENDAAFGTTQTSYSDSLKRIIAQSRKDAGWQVPWGIGDTVTHPNESTGAGTAGGQSEVANELACFPGANTDTLGNTYRYDTTHFNTTTGQQAHAQLWADAILAQPFEQGTAPVVIDRSSSKLCFYTGTWKCVQGL